MTLVPIGALTSVILFGSAMVAMVGARFLPDQHLSAESKNAVSASMAVDLQRNWRVGATLALPINARNSIKLYASNGVSARTGDNYKLAGIAWQYRWGGGI